MTLRWRLGSLILMDASTWAAGLLVALSLLAGAPPAGAVERLVFDSFLGAQLAPPGEVVDPNRSYDLPAGIAIDRLGVVYVADPNNNRVQVFDGSTVSSLRNFTIRDVTTGQVI